jgi:transcriptional regulator with XRE-family HTH domain
MTHPLISRLRDARIKKGVSLRKLGEALDLGGAMVSHIEQGHRDPKLTHVERWAAEVGLRLDLVEPAPELDERRHEMVRRFLALAPHLAEQDVSIWLLELSLRLDHLGLERADTHRIK